MANREELVIIRGARSGDAKCQLALGKLYLFGGASLPRNSPTALHWLCRAAEQNEAEAWRLAGRFISFEFAQNCRDKALPLYARAAAEGEPQAALVLAQLLLQPPLPEACAEWRLTAATALARLPGEEARQLGERLQQAALALAPAQCAHALPAGAMPAPPARTKPHAQPEPQARPMPQAGWGKASGAGFCAATSAGPAAPRPLPPGATAAAPIPHGDAELAQHELLERIWFKHDRRAFLDCALPLARSIVAMVDNDSPRSLSALQVTLLSRCVQALSELEQPGEELVRMRELAALGGDRTAQLALGLALARMNTDGDRVESSDGAVNFKRALRWLAQAGEQGLADAWFAMSRIYIRPEFSQRSLRDAQACLERAADMGHSGAQLECGIHAWRARRGDEQNDVKAAYWLQKAAAQGSAEAQAALERVAPSPEPSGWAASLLPLLTRELFSCQPLLAARIELAALFGLTRAEALLLDVKAADRGHCLVVDIRAYYGRSKRRLVLVRSAQQRERLERIIRLFEQVDCSPEGPEGNYRQRLYRFKTWLASDGGELVAA